LAAVNFVISFFASSFFLLPIALYFSNSSENTDMYTYIYDTLAVGHHLVSNGIPAWY
jgi:hypothetical protein